MRQQLHDLLDVHRAVRRTASVSGAASCPAAARTSARRAAACCICSTIFRTSSQFAAWPGRTAMMCAAQRPAQQRQVADDVQHLVPHKFLRIAQRLGRQHGVVADDDGVFQAAALDESVLDEKFDFLEKAKRPRVGQFLFPRLRRDFRADKTA